MNLLCIGGIVVVALVAFGVWAVCAAGARRDDYEERVLGIRRS